MAEITKFGVLAGGQNLTSDDDQQPKEGYAADTTYRGGVLGWEERTGVIMSVLEILDMSQE